MRFVWILAILCFFVHHTNGFSGTQLNSFSELANGLFKAQVKKIKIKDWSGKGIYLTDISITDAKMPKVTVTHNKGQQQLEVSVKGLGLSAKGKYRVKKKAWFIRYRESGSLRATVKKVSFQFPISLKRESMLQADRSKCSDSIGYVNYKARGKLMAFFANIFKPFIRNTLKKKFRGKLCDAVTNAINKHSKQLLGKLGR